MIRISQLKLPLHHTKEQLRFEVAQKLQKQPEELLEIIIRKKSIDARKKEEIYYSYTVDVAIKKEAQFLQRNKKKTITKAEYTSYHYEKKADRPMKYRPIIVGCGPAGLFCTYYLAKCGYRPILIERGEAVENRIKTVETFWKTGILNPESNVQFGEGGAGTFSDGKLNTMVKDSAGRIEEVLKTFVEHGAPEEILYINKPHIGTDFLQNIVKNMREHILSLGGEVKFGTKLTEIHVKDNAVSSIVVEKKKELQELPCDTLILAIGHSARDTFEQLYQSKIKIEAKSFAIGVRIEHNQEMISRQQYKSAFYDLAPADYKLTHTCTDKRGVYTFCMCPGGFVVNASSENGRLVVNGMSNHAREGKNANSAVVVTVTPDDFMKEMKNNSPLCGMYYQRKWEELAYKTGQGAVPIQLFGDLLEGKRSVTIGHILPQICGNYRLADLSECLPKAIILDLIEGITAFDRKITGFADEEAVLSGVEMRTSSPIRIVRDESYQSISLKGLYPCGEGAGYAGGITSAAVDGLKIFEAILKYRLPPVNTKEKGIK